MTATIRAFEATWHELDARFRECLAQVWTSLAHRGLPVGAVASAPERVDVGRCEIRSTHAPRVPAVAERRARSAHDR